MPLPPELYQQTAIHESSHAVIAVQRGFYVFGLMLNGPEHMPGAVWRQSPPGVCVENNHDCARSEVAVMLAGHLGEREFYGGHREEWLVGPGGDQAMMDYAGLLCVGSKAHLSAARESGMDSSVWRDELFEELPWDKIFELHHEERGSVEAYLHERRDAVQSIAKSLLEHGIIGGKVVYDALGVAWPGRVRTAEWADFPA